MFRVTACLACALTALALGQPASAQQFVNATFGALTGAGEGGLKVRGRTISSGDPNGHWEVSGGQLVPTAAGDQADLNAGPYSLTFANGRTAEIGIKPNAYTIIGEDQLLRVAKLKEALSGSTVELRATSRPYLPDMGQMYDTMGYFSKAVTFRSADLNNKARIRNWNFQGKTNPKNIIWEDLIVDADVKLMDGGPEYVRPLIRIDGGQNITVRRVEFDGNLPPWQAGRYEKADVQFEALNLIGVKDVVVEDSEFHNFVHGIGMIVGTNVTVRRNDFHRLWGDPINISPAPDGQTTGNIRITDNVSRDFIGNYNTYRHPDFIQIFPRGGYLNSGNINGLYVERNVVYMGIEVPGRGQGQGILIQEGREGQWPRGQIRNFVARNNIFYLDSVHGISNTSLIPRLIDPIITNNTIIPDGRASKPQNEYPHIRINASGGTVSHNLTAQANELTYDGTGPRREGENLVQSFRPPNLVGYRQLFGSLGNFSPMTHAEALGMAEMLSGGPLDRDKSGGPSAGDIGALVSRTARGYEFVNN